MTSSLRLLFNFSLFNFQEPAGIGSVRRFVASAADLGTCPLHSHERYVQINLLNFLDILDLQGPSGPYEPVEPPRLPGSSRLLGSSPMGSHGPPRLSGPPENLNHPDFLDLPRPPGPFGPP